ncbi:MAG: leucine-rich repeat domain-containing protein [Lachnospiraceae bacterium]|nr:leucine-rich repeat domain-containing protein [Lachnospiraceae bacterium]
MDDDKVLAGIIQDYPDALSDRKRLQALLMDFFPQDRRKRNLLMLVFDDGMVSEMRGLGQMDQMTLHRFVKSIELGYDIRTRSAEAAVTAWAKALGLSMDGNGDQREETQVCVDRQKPSAQKEWTSCESDSLYEFEETSRGLRILKYVDFDEPVVVIPNIIEGKKVIAVGNYAFKGCVGIEKIIISEGIEILGNGAFLNCKGLKEAVLPESLRGIGSTDATGCPKILGSEIKYEGAFEYSGLESVTVPDSVKYIGENSFAGCGQLKRAVLPDKLREIRENTFRWCKSLREVVFPRELEAVRVSAFEGCGDLQTVDLPEGVTSIEEGAFAGCKKLESIYIPDSVTEIGGGKGTGFLKTFGEPDERHEDFTIRCNMGSYAMQYARTWQIRCMKA